MTTTMQQPEADSGLILRPEPGLKLSTLANRLRRNRGTSVVAHNMDVHVDFVSDDPKITVKPDFDGGDGEVVELPVTPTGISELAGWLSVPESFLVRQDADLQDHIFSTLLEKSASSRCRIEYGEEGVRQIIAPEVEVIDPVDLVKRASNVLGEDGSVLRIEQNPREFYLDVIVPEGSSRGVGGDAKVGDLTRGGVRIHQNRRKNMAPQVSTLIWRLVCTNGMEFPDEGARVDARGSTVDEVLADFERMADLAFTRVEEQIEKFYALRDSRVENPERRMFAWGREHGISRRHMDEIMPMVTIMEDATEFDLANAITNYANSESLTIQQSRRLQQVGGEIVDDHARRCRVCQSRVQ